MKETIRVEDYANQITEALGRGILLNTKADKFNSMVIGWGHLGRIWNLPTFVVYVREGRYTKGPLDKTKEFSVSIPQGAPDAEINRICGSLSGRNIDKEKEAHLTLVEGNQIKVPGIKEYPITLECKVLYQQEQDLMLLPENLRGTFYPQDVDGTHPMANRDAHTMYIGQIVDAYIIR